MIMRVETLVFDLGFFSYQACFLSLAYLALASTAASKQGRLFSSVSVTFLLPCTLSCSPCTGSKIIMLLMEELIKPSRLVFYLGTLGQRLGSNDSVVHMTASFLSKCLEWCFMTFIDLDFKLVLFFEKSINRRDWHQHAFHWVLKKRGPLKIARLFKKIFFFNVCNKLL